jgi:short-subunit dehydrogenase
MTFWQKKVVVVTGGSAGLGLSIARKLHGQAAHVVLGARDEQRLAAAASQIDASARRIRTVAADITVQQQVDALFTEIRRLPGRLDALVNCAGRSARGEAWSTEADDFQRLWEINFLALARCTQAAVPLLVESRGHLVNIGSLAAKSAARHLGPYPASKFPVAAYSQQLRLELGPRGVHVLLVCPGPIARPDAGHRYDSVPGIPQAARKPGGGVKLNAIDPDLLAERILRACQRRQPDLTVPGRARLLFAISQLWPRLGDWIVTKMT